MTARQASNQLPITDTPFSVANASTCPQHYANGKEPLANNSKLQAGFVELCAPHGGFATGYSAVIRDPFYSAEHITAAHLDQHYGRARVNSFRADDRLPTAYRAELTDYVRSGYDRGHLAPDADSWSDETEADTFVLSNMIPQAPLNNRGLHAKIEGATRHLAFQNGEVYAVTGAIYSASPLPYINGRVAVPQYIFKLVFVPRLNAAAAYLEENSNDPERQTYRVVSLDEINQMTGFNLMPGIHSPALLDLPAPLGGYQKRGF